jgi:hypothetical protein
VTANACNSDQQDKIFAATNGAAKLGRMGRGKLGKAQLGDKINEAGGVQQHLLRCEDSILRSRTSGSHDI